jgi:hypothetical protein
MILRQDSSDLKPLREALQLSDEEVRAVSNFARVQRKRKDSECLLIVGATRGVIRLVPSPLDYWICTSEPNEDRPRREAAIAKTIAENPGISRTDALRKSVYQLSCEGFG